MDSTEISLCDAYASGRRDFLKAAVSFAVTLAASRLPSAWAADEPAMPAPRSRAHQVRITNLSDYPPGQEVPGCLRHAVLNAKPDTRITFAAPGTINLQRPLFIETDGLTIDGESAPVVIYGDNPADIAVKDIQLVIITLMDNPVTGTKDPLAHQ